MAGKNQGGNDVPKRITHYSIGGAIGGGGMGVVYRGTDRRDDSPVAIKILHPHLAEDESFRERFEREAHVGALLRSPYVVRLLDYGFAEGRYFIVMEFVEGENLKDAIAAGPLTASRTVRIGAQTARALEEAEARGIVHRDIKPDNILLAPGDAVKVADFGIAKQLSSGTLTMPGAFIGTLFYAAPELALGKADNRSDVYSLGATLFHSLTGHPPFRGDALEVLRHHAETQVPVDELQSIPEVVREIIVKCLQKDPADRYQSCTQLAGDLEKAASRLGQATEDATAVITPEPETEAGAKSEELTAATQVVPPEEPAPAPVQSSPTEVAAPPVEATPTMKEPELAAKEPRPEPAGAPGGRGPARPAPPSRKRGMPSWIPAGIAGLAVAAAAVGALVFLGNLGGDDGGEGTEQPATIGRNGLRRMLPSQIELGPEYTAFRLNPDVSGYVTSGAVLGPACPAPTGTATPPPVPVESYDNQFEFEQSLVTESETFAVIEGVDNFADEDAAAAALQEFLAAPADDINLGGCTENEILEAEDFAPAGMEGDAAGVEHLIHQTDGDETEREFTVTAVGFTRGTILGRVLIAHFDSPDHQLSAAEIALKLDLRIQEVLAEESATPQATPSPTATASASATPSASAGTTPTPTATAVPIQPPKVVAMGCSPASLTTGQTLNCSPTVSGGAASSRTWSAPGGSPSSGSGSSFSTSFGSSGTKTISLQVCNDGGCDTGSKFVTVSSSTPPPPAVPVINGLGCSPSSVQTGQTVTCNPSVSGTVTAYGWSAAGGSPSEGAGSTFSTSFSSAGTKFIGFAVCNASGCSDGVTQAITVTAPVLGTYTVSTENVFVYPDDTVQVSIFVDTPSAGLGDYDIDLIYDPAVITPLSCTDWYGGSCDEFFFSDTVNFFGTANDTGNLIIGSVTFGVVDCCDSDLLVSVFDMKARDGTDASSYVVEVDGSVTVLLYIY